MAQSICNACGAQLIELERWSVSVQDFEAKAQSELGRGLTANGGQRFAEYIGEGSIWREVSCPHNPAHVGRLFERVEPVADSSQERG